MAQKTTVLTAALLSVLGCSGPPPPYDERWSAGDGVRYEDGIFVLGERSVVDPSELSLRTWPELELVPSTVSVAPWPETIDPRDTDDTIARFNPDEPLGWRWYAIQWRESDPPSEHHARVVGIPLADGTVVWRFYVLDPPGALDPPPVPAELCADVACE